MPGGTQPCATFRNNDGLYATQGFGPLWLLQCRCSRACPARAPAAERRWRSLLRGVAGGAAEERLERSRPPVIPHTCPLEQHPRHVVQGGCRGVRHALVRKPCHGQMPQMRQADYHWRHDPRRKGQPRQPAHCCHAARQVDNLWDVVLVALGVPQVQHLQPCQLDKLRRHVPDLHIGR